MTLCLSFSSVFPHAVAFSPPQAEDEWSSLPLGTQKTMAFFYLHVRIVTGFSLDGLVLKLIPRKREEMDYVVTNIFNLKLLISPLWSSWLPTNSISGNCPSFYPAILRPLTCPFPSNLLIHLFSIFLSSIFSSTIFIMYLSYSIHLPFVIHPLFIHTLTHTLSISPSAYHPSAFHFHLFICHPPSTLHSPCIYHSSLHTPSIYPLSSIHSFSYQFMIHLSLTCL